MHIEVPKHFQTADRLVEKKDERTTCVVVLPKVNKAPWKELLEKIPRQKVLTLPRGYQVPDSTCSVPVEVWWMYPLHTVFLEGRKAHDEQVQEPGSAPYERSCPEKSQSGLEPEVEKVEGGPQSESAVAGITSGSSGALRCVNPTRYF